MGANRCPVFGHLTPRPSVANGRCRRYPVRGAPCPEAGSPVKAEIQTEVLIEILGERGADRIGHDRHMAVVRVIEADHDLRAGFLEGRDLLRLKWEADELDR